MKNTYVQAMTQLIAQGQAVEGVLARTKAVMETRGHDRLYGEVLKEVIKALEANAVAETPTVTVAKEKDAASAEAKKALALIGCTDVSPKIEVDDTIIGGAIATKGSTHIDMSYKNALRKLYQAITS